MHCNKSVHTKEPLLRIILFVRTTLEHKDMDKEVIKEGRIPKEW